MRECNDSQSEAGSSFRKLLKERIEKANPRRTLTAEDRCAYRAASAVWQTFDTEEQVNKRTEERVWIKHVLRRTVCECRLRKLLNCNSYTSV